MKDNLVGTLITPQGNEWTIWREAKGLKQPVFVLKDHTGMPLCKGLTLQSIMPQRISADDVEWGKKDIPASIIE